MSEATAKAEAPAAEGAEGEVAPKKTGKKKLFVILGIVVVLIIVGAIGGFFYLRAQQAKAAKLASGDIPPAHSEKHDAPPPAFLPLDNFTVNLTTDSDPHYLQLGLTLEISDPHAADSVKTYLPIIRSRILILLTSKSPEQINTLEGKKLLAKEILEITRSHLPELKEDPENNKGVRDVLFASFVIQ